MKKLVAIVGTMLLFSAASAKSPLPFGDGNVRNWATNADTVYIQADKADLDAKVAGAAKFFVVLSTRYLDENKFWAEYPEFTEKCVIGKAHDFTWIEATEVPLDKIKSDQFKVSNAKGAYYTFLLVEKDGKLQSVKVTRCGDQTKLTPKSDAVEVANGQALNRTWDDDKKGLCK